MAVFICCADESTDARQEADFFYGGFAATVSAWDDDFAPAWNERVLARPPVLEYLHMADIANKGWRERHRITWQNADYRLTEAARVIGSCGGLVPIIWKMSQQRFKEEVLPYAPLKGHSGIEAPDYLAFLAFAYSALEWLLRFRPEVEAVDFWVERNQKITTRIGRFHERLPGNLRELGRDDLAALVRGYSAVEKERIPAQAADMLVWHERNRYSGELDLEGERRRRWMIYDREGMRGDVDSLILDGFVKALQNTYEPRRRLRAV